MIGTESVGRVVRRAAPPRWGRWAAWLHGLRDGRRGLPDVPPPPALPEHQAAVTPYVTEQQATARRAVEQLRARLMYRERRLIADLGTRAVHVVIEYRERGRPAPAALAGFGERVAEWHAHADVCRCRAAAVLEQVNQHLARYWDAVRRHHPDVPDPAPAHLAHWGPAPLRLDPSWDRPDSWLAPRDAATATVLTRALELLDAAHSLSGTPGGGN
ncbi:hypothetical protein [Streptomyces hoynatensis]|uniref:Uncharacterized protein n=1 Tax=Streptomyces hoynatensis TaxID=1141874 RepID=A0A3A9ZEB3_9ACTN|nr:hypothetical protein [Streptomyces hoynatensis]RKN46693.1 hypothetical protein D7294_00210 [Streptomyces hoynatensis]